MWYEINVAKIKTNGRYEHYFATAERSITTELELRFILKHFMVLFPAPEYDIIATRREITGIPIDIKTLIK